MADSGVNIIQDPYAAGQPGQGGAPNAQTGASPVTATDPGASPGGAAGGGSSGAASAPQAPSGGGASTSKNGTGFVNIQNVLNANKGSGAQLGNAIGSGITQQATDVGNQLGQAQQTFGAQAAAGTVGNAADQSAVSNILGGISGYSAPTVNTVGSGSTSTTPAATTTTPNTVSYQQAGAAPASGPNGFPTTQNSIANPWSASQISAYQAANPTPAAGQNLSTPLDAGLTQGNVSQFGQLLAGQYTGPQELSGIDQLNQQAQQVAALGQNIGTSGGQQQLLQQFVGGNNANYGAGAQGLDQLLLGQGGAQPLQKAAAGTALLPGQVASAQSAAENQANLDQASSAQYGTQLQAQLAAAQAGILAPAQQLAANAQTADTTTQNNFAALQALLQPSTTAAGTGANSTASLNNPQQAIQSMQTQGLITPAQAGQLNTLITQGYIDPNSTANAAYEAAQSNPGGFSTFANPSTTTVGTPTGTGGSFNPANPAQGTFNPANPAQGTFNPSGLTTTPGGFLTNAQALAAGDYTPTYSSLSAGGQGYDPATLLLNNLSNTQAQGNGTLGVNGATGTTDPSAFLTSSQQAQLNALSQLQGTSQNALTTNVPVYQAASNNFNFANLMSQLGSNTALNAGPAPGAPAAPGSSAGPNLSGIAALNPVTAPLAFLPQMSLPSFSFAQGGLVPENKFNKLSSMFKRK